MVYTRETTEMKKIINNPNAVVEEMLQGIEIANPDVLYDREGVVIARKEKSDKVGLVSGGDRKSTRLNSSHMSESRMPSSA